LIDTAVFLHFLAVIVTFVISTITVGISEGLIAHAGLVAINMQPKAFRNIATMMYLGIALAETAAILSSIIAILLVMSAPVSSSDSALFVGIAKIGISIVVSFTGGVIGLVSYLPAQEACYATARQPFFSAEIRGIMLITLCLIQTSSIFGFIVAYLIMGQLDTIISIGDSMRLLASGLAVGIGSIGPAIGLGVFSGEACRSVGINREAYPKIRLFTVLSVAIIEAPILFSLLISLILIISANIRGETVLHGTAFLSAAFAVGFSTFGTGINSGKIAAQACKNIAHKPSTFQTISRVSLLAQGLLDTLAIYGLIIAIFLIFIIR